MLVPQDARILIIEGIAGAGKDTLQQHLNKELENKTVYCFSEEELLFSWKHAWIPEIASLRLQLINKLLDECESALASNPDTYFIFNRFHISLPVLAQNVKEELPERYAHLISRLKKLPVHVFVPVLEEETIVGRASHPERKDNRWKQHLEKRLETRGFSDLSEMYIWEQKQVLEKVEEQGISYSLWKIEREGKPQRA